MKNATAHARKLIVWLRKIRKQFAGAGASAEATVSPLDALILAYLTWQCGRRQAEAGHQKLMKTMVDHNDLRVTDPRHVAAILGERYPQALDRSKLLIRALHAIYHKEHHVNLDRLATMPRREARAYLDSLDGMMPFVSASVMLLGLGGHGVPVDEALLGVLRQAGLVDPKATLAEVQSFLENQIKADEARGVYDALRGYIESLPSSEWKKATSQGTDKAAPPVIVKAAPAPAPAAAGKKGASGTAAKGSGKGAAKAAAPVEVKAKGGAETVKAKAAPAASQKQKPAAAAKVPAVAKGGKPAVKTAKTKTPAARPAASKAVVAKAPAKTPAKAPVKASAKTSAKVPHKAGPGNGAAARPASGKAKAGASAGGAKKTAKSGNKKSAGPGARGSARR